MHCTSIVNSALHIEEYGPKLVAVRRSAALALIAAIATGCPAGKQTPDSSITGRLVLKGSTTFGDELAPRLVTEFRNQRPNVAMEVEFKGSESGFAALLARECDIAAVSRPATKVELETARRKGMELNDAVVGYYGVAIIANSNNPVSKLTQAQVRDIFSGAIRNWKVVGGADGPINLCIRDQASATHRGFQALAMERRAYAHGARTFPNYLELVASVRQDPHAVGYCSMSLAERTGVKNLLVDGMPPTVTSVNQDRYPYARGLHLYTIKRTETIATRDFVQFVQSSEGQKILAQLDFVRRFEPRFDSYVRD